MTCRTSLFKFFMSDFKKIRLNPVDPYFTIEIDFFEDVEDVGEQIREKQEGPKKEEVSPNKEADPPSEEANTDTNK